MSASAPSGGVGPAVTPALAAAQLGARELVEPAHELAGGRADAVAAGPAGCVGGGRRRRSCRAGWWAGAWARSGSPPGPGGHERRPSGGPALERVGGHGGLAAAVEGHDDRALPVAHPADRAVGGRPAAAIAAVGDLLARGE